MDLLLRGVLHFILALDLAPIWWETTPLPAKMMEHGRTHQCAYHQVSEHMNSDTHHPLVWRGILSRVTARSLVGHDLVRTPITLLWGILTLGLIKGQILPLLSVVILKWQEGWIKGRTARNLNQEPSVCHVRLPAVLMVKILLSNVHSYMATISYHALLNELTIPNGSLTNVPAYLACYGWYIGPTHRDNFICSECKTMDLFAGPFSLVALSCLSCGVHYLLQKYNGFNCYMFQYKMIDLIADACSRIMATLTWSFFLIVRLCQSFSFVCKWQRPTRPKCSAFKFKTLNEFWIDSAGSCSIKSLFYGWFTKLKEELAIHCVGRCMKV